MSERALVVASGGGIGDLFLATPVLRALRSRFSHITVLINPKYAEVLAPHLADDVWFDEGSLWALRNRIASAKFDAGFVTWASARVAYAMAFAQVPIRVGQASRLYSPFFTHRVKVKSEFGDHKTHWTQILLDYPRAIGIDGDPLPIAPITPEANEEAKTLLASLGLSPGGYAILHPTRGISSLRARWPSSSFAELATRLHARFGVELLISGSAADKNSALGIARRAKAHSIAGDVSLRGFTALAAQARYVASMDSGPMHLAAATGVPTVGIFAMRPDEPYRWAPVGPRTATVLPTYPCPRIHTKENCPNFACVRELNYDAVLDAVAGLIDVKSEAS